MKQFYSTREVAEILNAPRYTVIYWIKTGKLRAFKVGERWRVPREELLRILAPLGSRRAREALKPARSELRELLSAVGARVTPTKNQLHELLQTAGLHVKPQRKTVRVRGQRATERLREQRVTERKEGKRAK